MSVRSAWPVHDMMPAKMSRDGTPRLFKVEQSAEQRGDNRKRKSADLERKRNTIIARMIIAIQAGALSCTHADARRLVHNWSDGKVKDVYRQITEPSRTQRPAAKRQGSVQNRRRNMPYTMADDVVR